MHLKDFFSQHPRAALGFSGGVDSAYLLYAAMQCGADIHPYFIQTVFQPQFELDDAKRLTKMLGAPLTVLKLDILSCPNIISNPADRCYHCKTALFGRLKEQALRDGYRVLLDGTNASDDADDRPGMRALRELSVRSPLRECGLTKPEIRQLSHDAGLFTWDKPAYACLATRIASGHRISAAMLHRIEAAEGALAALGFRDFRVRVYHDAARIQLKHDEMEKAIAQRTEILYQLNPYFPTVFLDLEGR